MSEQKASESIGGSSHTASSPKGSRVELSPPWRVDTQRVGHQTNVGQFVRDAPPEVINGFIAERSRVHETYIKEQAKNKRIGLVLAFVLILSAAGIVMFAPEGRQAMSYWVGFALLIFAAGASGFGRIWGKTKSISFGADQDKHGLTE